MTKFDNFKLLKRYWVKFAPCASVEGAAAHDGHHVQGLSGDWWGVTAYTSHDALSLIERQVPNFFFAHTAVGLSEFVTFRECMGWIHTQPGHPNFGMRGTRESDRLDVEQIWRGIWYPVLLHCPADHRLSTN